MKNTKKFEFGFLLTEIMKRYSIEDSYFASKIGFDASTVRHWRTGNRLPKKYNNNQTTIDLIIESLIKITCSNKDSYSDDILMETLKNHINNYTTTQLPPKAKEQIIKEENIELFINYILKRTFEYKVKCNTYELPIISANKKNPKIVVFDFDGTLTKSNQVKTTWESIWIELGYSIEHCQKLHKQFNDKKITHEQWCELTQQYFIEKKLNKSVLIDIAKRIEIIDGFQETIEYLKQRNILLYILSGSITEVIREVLGEYWTYFDRISANKFLFSQNNILEKIIGTKYDFKGKADFLTNITKHTKIPVDEILFIGNSSNDHHAHESGVRTLCINPHRTHYDNLYWHDYIETVTNLKNIIPYIFPEDSQTS